MAGATSYPYFNLLNQGGGSTGRQYNASNLVSSQVWNHYAFTYSVSAGVGKIYVNGSLYVTGPADALTSEIRGYNFFGSSVYTDVPDDTTGYFDDIKFFNVSLTQSQIMYLMNGIY